MEDYGIQIHLRLKSDATAAVGIVSCLGLGKVRDLAKADLWVQQKARKKEIQFDKVLGSSNPADSFTNPFDPPSMWKLMDSIGVTRWDGRP